jgi:microcystin-dependent protein
MTLVAALTPMVAATTGDLEYTVAVISTLTSLQEPETGWLLCNGAAIANSGKYVALYAFLGTLYGSAGTLPTLIDGVQPISRGATDYPTINATDGAKTVTLGVADVAAHTHTWDFESTATPDVLGWANYGSIPPYDDGGYEYPSNSGSAGSGGAHNNMSPYVVVQGMLIKL